VARMARKRKRCVRPFPTFCEGPAVAPARARTHRPRLLGGAEGVCHRAQTRVRSVGSRHPRLCEKLAGCYGDLAGAGS
jgi:hypothetical protein